MRGAIVAVLALVSTGCDLVFELTPPPRFESATNASSAGSASLSYAFTVGDASDRFLLVSVHIGTDCFERNPATTTVTYLDVPLELVASIVGTPCGMNTTRSEHWKLVAPPVGTGNVVITLESGASTIHSGALAFTGVNQSTPVREFQTASGNGTSSSMIIASDPTDLVVDTIGQGTGIDAPGSGQTSRFVRNVDTTNTQNNTGASTAPGARSVALTWNFTGMPDEWQAIATSLQP
jgi:hypothetical protein